MTTEAMVHSLEGLTRTSKVALEESLGVSISSKLSDSAVVGATSEFSQKQVCCASELQNNTFC